MKSSLIALAIVLFASNAAFAQTTAEKNGILTDEGSGKTLYTFDKDSPGKPSCTGGCSNVWPPFAAKDGAKDQGKFTVVARDDGVKQWAMDGKPLYMYSLDAKPGDTNGDGIGGVWHAVRSGKATPPSPAPAKGMSY
jgi:predicted lipoprotein with Yx(FWY)xxD motif